METPIDPCTEPLLTLNKVRELPELMVDGKKRDLSAVHRWCMKGVLKDGARVKLASIVIGGVRCSTHGAVRRFLADLNRLAAMPEGPVEVYQALGKRERDAERADRELAAAGI